jgi:Protein of unknown function (DUF2851)
MNEPLILPNITEQHLAALWSVQGGGLLRGPFWTVAHEAIAVIYRGRFDGGPGPDFRDAVIALGDNLPRGGDVELHLHAADWQRHGHDTSPAYNNVVLHVTLWPPRPSDAPTRRADGQAVTELALLPYLNVELTQLPTAVAPYMTSIKRLAEQEEACWAGAEQLPADVWGRLLDAAGDARFSEKAALFEAAIAGYDPMEHAGDAEDYAAQVLYAGLMDGLGYSQNRVAFGRLAQAAPLARLTQAGRRDEAGWLALLESALLGVAGLLPSQRSKSRPLDWPSVEYGAELEQQWLAASRTLGVKQAISDRDAKGWQWAKVRPANYPPRRVAGAAALLARFAGDGLLDGLRHAVEAGDLRDALVVRQPDSFWATHGDFGVGLGEAEHDLIGESRAAELAVNIVLPFFHAYASLRDDAALAARTKRLYDTHPRLADNEVTRRMANELLGKRKHERGLLGLARRQQGLMHLYRRYCGERRCEDCPVAAALRSAEFL